MKLREEEVKKVALALTGANFILQTKVDGDKITYHPQINLLYTGEDPGLVEFLKSRVGGIASTFEGQQVWGMIESDTIHDLITGIYPYSTGWYRLKLNTMARYFHNIEAIEKEKFAKRRYKKLLDDIKNGDSSELNTDHYKRYPPHWEYRYIHTPNSEFSEEQYSKYNLPSQEER